MSTGAESPLVSVFTTATEIRHLDRQHRSLRDQSCSDWEWIVLLGRKASQWKPAIGDPRVKIERAAARDGGSGASKRAACASCTGDILVELDEGDLMTNDCLAEVVGAFAEATVVLAYSDFALINPDGSPSHEQFDPEYGWEFTEVTIEGATYSCCHALAATPHNVGHIWYAPNHVRAFRRDAYEQVGGHDAALEYLDDQDLMSRLYAIGEFAHIPRCLYLERLSGTPTAREDRINAAIQTETLVLYRRLIENLALAWAERRGLRCLHLRTPTWVGDEPDGRYEDVVVDPAAPTIPAEADSVGVVRAYDVLQRLPHRADFFNECHRVLAHAGLMLTQTPSSDGRGAFQDPTHTAFYNQNSFMYVTQKALHQLVPDLTARFQLSHLRTFFPTDDHAEMQIPYVEANLLAIKDGPRQGGPLLC